MAENMTPEDWDSLTSFLRGYAGMVHRNGRSILSIPDAILYHGMLFCTMYERIIKHQRRTAEPLLTQLLGEMAALVSPVTIQGLNPQYILASLRNAFAHAQFMIGANTMDAVDMVRFLQADAAKYGVLLNELGDRDFPSDHILLWNEDKNGVVTFGIYMESLNFLQCL